MDNDPIGSDHLTILRRLATGNNAFRGDNHALPVLQELVNDGMTFVVFPLVFEYGGFTSPWYYNFGEMVDAIEQVLEVCRTRKLCLVLRRLTFLYQGSRLLPRALSRTLGESSDIYRYTLSLNGQSRIWQTTIYSSILWVEQCKTLRSILCAVRRPSPLGRIFQSVIT